MRDHYRGNKDIVFITVQTVFEGFGTNTIEYVEPTMEKYGLGRMPAGHDAGRDGKGSELMHRYRSGGTPWVVIIDRDGIVRYNSYSLPVERGIGFIDGLLAKKPAPK